MPFFYSFYTPFLQLSRALVNNNRSPCYSSSLCPLTAFFSSFHPHLHLSPSPQRSHPGRAGQSGGGPGAGALGLLLGLIYALCEVRGLMVLVISRVAPEADIEGTSSTTSEFHEGHVTCSFASM